MSKNIVSKNIFGKNKYGKNKVAKSAKSKAATSKVKITNHLKTSPKTSSKNPIKYPWKNLVFEGGGVKGVAYGGALGVLEREGILPQIERVAGTSAGALAATFLALGYSSSEMTMLLRSVDLRNLVIDSKDIFSNTNRLFSRFGLYKGNTFENWLGDLIEKKTKQRNLTFLDLKRLQMKNSLYLDLYIVATNLNSHLSEVFSFEHTPHVPILHALRASLSYPLLLVPKEINSALYVDGGMLLNYPVRLFDDVKYVEESACRLEPEYYAKKNKKMGTCYVYNKQTLGLRVDSSEEIKTYQNDHQPGHHEIKDFVSFSKNLITVLLDHEENKHYHSDDWDRTVYISSLGVKTTDFHIPPQLVEELIQSGIDHTQTYLNWWKDLGQAKTPKNQLPNVNIWGQLKYFKRTEKWGDPDRMNPKLLVRLEAFRELTQCPVIISRGTQGKNEATNSQHPHGNAVDVVVPAFKGHILDLFFLASSLGFTGIGIYRDWTYQGQPTKGLHLDMRPLQKKQRAARWLCYSENSQQKYTAFTFENLKKYHFL